MNYRLKYKMTRGDVLDAWISYYQLLINRNIINVGGAAHKRMLILEERKSKL
tara:strand:+ start:114 stop:269 length:156 start_codon:yes stop_codon:yes gene_type:complete